MSKNTKIYENVKAFLLHRKWVGDGVTQRFDVFIPHEDLGFSADFKLYLPNETDKEDFLLNIKSSIKTLSEIYELDYYDLCEVLIENKHILKFHFEHSNIIDGKPTLTQFDNILSKIKSLLYDAASFVVLNKMHVFEKEVEESERYLNYCRFISNEKGSLITKIELPNEEEIKIPNLFEDSLRGSVINNRLINVVEYINNNILIDEYTSPTDDELVASKDLISVNLVEKVRDFYRSIDSEDVDVELMSIENSRLLSAKGINDIKLSNLNTFIQDVRKRLNEINTKSIVGKVIVLSSRDIEKDNNSIRVRAMIDNVVSEVLVMLNSINYHEAIKAHDGNLSVRISGVFEKRKSDYKVSELHTFEIIRNHTKSESLFTF